MTFSFAKVRTLKGHTKRRKKRKPIPATPVHNFMDVAETVHEIARIIDPDAFPPTTEPMDIEDLMARAIRQAAATEKARMAVAVYDRVLGNQRRLRVIVKQRNRTRVFSVMTGKSKA